MLSVKGSTVQAKVVMINGKRMMMADTGATHILKGIKNFSELKGYSREVRLDTATGAQTARMQNEVVYVEGEDLQSLFPLASYVKYLNLEMTWNSEVC